jgi:hypothetical protein
MLDVSYPSWSELVAACREARAYLRNPDNALSSWSQVADYSFAKVRKNFEERCFIDGDKFVTRVVHVSYFW